MHQHGHDAAVPVPAAANQAVQGHDAAVPEPPADNQADDLFTDEELEEFSDFLGDWKNPKGFAKLEEMLKEARIQRTEHAPKQCSVVGCRNLRSMGCSELRCGDHCSQKKIKDGQCPRHNGKYARFLRFLPRFLRGFRRRAGKEVQLWKELGKPASRDVVLKARAERRSSEEAKWKQGGDSSWCGKGSSASSTWWK